MSNPPAEVDHAPEPWPAAPLWRPLLLSLAALFCASALERAAGVDRAEALLWWPAGLSVILALRWGPACLPGVWVGSLLGGLLFTGGIGLEGVADSAALACAGTLHAALAWLLGGRDPSLRAPFRWLAALRLALLAGLLAALPGAAVIVLCRVLTGALAAARGAEVFAQVALADALACAALLSLDIALRGREEGSQRARAGALAAALIAGSIGLGWLAAEEGAAQREVAEQRRLDGLAQRLDGALTRLEAAAQALGVSLGASARPGAFEALAARLLPPGSEAWGGLAWVQSLSHSERAGREAALRERGGRGIIEPGPLGWRAARSRDAYELVWARAGAASLPLGADLSAAKDGLLLTGGAPAAGGASRVVAWAAPGALLEAALGAEREGLALVAVRGDTERRWPPAKAGVERAAGRRSALASWGGGLALERLGASAPGPGLAPRGLLAACLLCVLIAVGALRESRESRVHLRAAIERETRDLRFSTTALKQRLRSGELSASEARRQRDEALAASAQQSESLAVVSHELRNPLHAVAGASELLSNTQLDDEQADLVATVQASTRALLAQLNDILDASKLRARELVLEEEPVDLRRCLDEALDLSSPQARAKSLELVAILAPGVPNGVLSDPLRLRQILVNLLGNAVKFTKQGSVTVELRERSLPGDERVELEFAVRDTGLGIPESLRDALFEPYKQGDSTTFRRFGGTGLGLTICRQLVELMGGRIWVSRASPGLGSTFRFTIRARPCEVAEQRPEQLPRGAALVVTDSAPLQRDLSARMARWGVEVAALGMAEARAGALPEPPVTLAFVDARGAAEVGLEAQLRERYEGLRIIRIGGRAESTITAALRLPIKQEDLSSAITAAARGQRRASRRRRTRAADERLAERRPQRILVVDDDAVNLKLTTSLLRRLGYEAQTAMNGIEALEAARAERFDVVLLDLQMPLLDGRRTARRLISEAEPRERPRIVAVTGEEPDEGSADPIFDAWLQKPLSVDRLAALLDAQP